MKSFLFTCWLVSLLAVLKGDSAGPCSLKLCRILARDITSPEYHYLSTISKEIIAQKPLLFQEPQINAVLSTFASKYDLEVEVINASGSKEIYYPYATGPQVDNPLKCSPSLNLAQTYLGFPGFKLFQGDAYYSFHLFSDNAEYLVITLKQHLMTY